MVARKTSGYLLCVGDYMSTIERIRELYAKRREIDEEIDQLNKQLDKELLEEDTEVRGWTGNHVSDVNTSQINDVDT